MLKDFIKNKSMENYERLSQCKTEARKILRKKKRDNFNKFVEGINKNVCHMCRKK